MRDDPIVIESHDPAWATAFRVQAAAVEGAIGPWLAAPVEHIGSTSVPGLDAKPIIDMLALVDDHEVFGSAVEPLERIGWLVSPEPGDAERRRWSLCRPSIERRTHHLHVVEQASAGWPDWLLFRDYLRVHVEAAEQYADLKRTLAAGDRSDRVRYRSGKAPLIAELMERARTWRDAGRP